MRIVIVQHEEVLRRLRGKELLLHRLIDLHRTVADDVVGGHIQLGDNRSVKMCGCLHLIARDLRRNRTVCGDLLRHVDERHAYVAPDANRCKMRAQQLAEQSRRCGLAVRPRDGVDGCACNLSRQLHLCRNTDAACMCGSHERDALGHGGREDDKIRPLEQFFPLCAKDAGDSLRPQIFDMFLRQCIFFRICLVLRIGERHARARCREVSRRRKAADARPDDECRLILIGQFPVSPLLEL